ncbi:MAG TPA: SGNH hydrolase domain-containing protein [Tabrizicola sp.]|nr:SGNH hydrolase domain-containing protein [Tabrizicola sp.]
MADLIRARAKADRISTLIQVNRWKGLEHSPEAQVELELWWGEVFDTIILVGPLPSFENPMERHLRWTREELETVAPSFKDAKLFAQARERVSGSQVRIIDPVPLFCGDRPNCSVFGQGLLMGDESGHLMKEGKQIYADALEASGVLEEFSP